MNDDLLDLLSRIRKAVHDALPDKTDPLELDAAIEVALRENAELGKRYDELAKMVDRRMGELEAENERLRAALIPIAEHENWQISEADSYGGTNYEWIGDGGEAFEIAAAALASTRRSDFGLTCTHYPSTHYSE